MTSASEVSSSPKVDEPVQQAEGQQNSPAPELSNFSSSPSWTFSLLAHVDKLFVTWLSLSLSLFVLELYQVVQSGTQYWFTLALSQWGLMTTLSLLLVSILYCTKGLFNRSWPQFRTLTWPQRLVIFVLFISSLLSIILLTQYSVEWTSKHFRQVSYRGLFTGLVAAFISVLNVLFMPWLTQQMMKLLSFTLGYLSDRFTRPNPTRSSSLGQGIKRKILITFSAVVSTSLMVLYADLIVILVLPKLNNVDLRPITFLLGALWLSLTLPYLGKLIFGLTYRETDICRRLWKHYFLSLSLSLLSMIIGLFSAYQLSPEQWLKLERDSALSSIVVSQIQQYSDQDQDGVSAHWGGGDCDDTDSKKRPGIADQKRKDSNCNGIIRFSRQPFMSQKTISLSQARQAIKAQVKPKNIILLTIDALRYDAFREDMPFTQNFAKKAIDFTKAYSAGAATYWSIPALLGSRPPSYFEMGRDQTPVNRERLLTESLRDAAFHTALYANVTIFFVRGLSQGAYTKNYDTSRYTAHGAKPGSAHLTSSLIKHIDRWKAGKLKPNRDRFFLWGHYYDPHDPYFEVQSYEAKDQSSHSRYRAIVRSVDQELNRLYKALESRDLLNNTMVILTADHGDEFYDHNHRFHGKTLYDEMVRVPLLIYSPAYAPRKVDQVVSHLDVAPTVLSHLGLAREKRFMGFNHDVALSLGQALTKDEAFFEVLPDQNYSKHMIGLRLGDEKMIYSSHLGAFEHYNLVADPGEKVNLFTKQSNYKNEEIYTKLMRYVEAQLYTLGLGKAGVHLPKSR